MAGIADEPDRFAAGEPAVDAAIGAYNAEQAAVAARVRMRLTGIVGATVVIAVAAAFLAIAADPDHEWFGTLNIFIYVGGFFGLLMAWDFAVKPARLLQQSLRDRILPHAFAFLEEVRYQHKAEPRSLTELPRSVIGSYNRTTLGDVIAGRFEGLPLEIFEALFKFKGGKSESVAFKGLVVGFQLENPYAGTLVAIRRSGSMSRWFRDTFSSGDETIDFVNPEIGEAFEVRASDARAARRIVDGALAKTLVFLRRTWPDGQPRLALNGQSGFVLLPSTKDFFELPKIGTPIVYAAHIAPMTHELRSLAAIARLAAQIR
ncbi:MAG: DUF3137 domain-containing protein [Rhizobiaceae bacterium]